MKVRGPSQGGTACGALGPWREVETRPDIEGLAAFLKTVTQASGFTAPTKTVCIFSGFAPTGVLVCIELWGHCGHLDHLLVYRKGGSHGAFHLLPFAPLPSRFCSPRIDVELQGHEVQGLMEFIPLIPCLL